MSSKPPASTETVASFEHAIKRLNEIVETLEEGVKLSQASQERLDKAQRKVEELLGVDAEGRPRTAPLDTTGDDDEMP